MPTADSRLAGIRVLVTRPATQAAGLMELIRDAGGEPVAFPTLEIAPLAPAAGELQRLAASDTVIFVSANAVAHGYPLLRDTGAAGRRILAVGRATAQALGRMGCRDVDAPPGDRSSSEDLLALPGLANVTGRAICIVRGRGGREALKRELELRGARVAYLECYERRLPSEPRTTVLARALGDVHVPLVVSVTSVAGLVNLIGMAPAESMDRLLSRPLVVIGSRQEAAALQKGWTGPLLRAGAGDAEIVDAIAAWGGQT